jgi:senataxin
MNSGPARFLICAPSNAAIDEIVTRIATNGIIGASDESSELTDMLLRIGSMEYEPSPTIKKFTMAYKLHGDKIFKLNRKPKKHGPKPKKPEIRPRREEWSLRRISKKNMRVRRKIRVEERLILGSSIICCTLSMSGIDSLQITKGLIDYLIIDEACQCIEPSTLIPFNLRPRRIILVGDHNQLPATTFSSNSNDTKFSRSLFERLLQGGYEKTMLTIQYRMFPTISQFPSGQFYDGKITDHSSVTSRGLPSNLKNLEQLFNSRVVFFDLYKTKESTFNVSKQNQTEAEFTQKLIEMIQRISTQAGSLSSLSGRIGIISPYKAQVMMLKRILGSFCSDQGHVLRDTIEVNTVDGFQGR